MISLTDSAVRRITAMREEKASPEQHLRLFVEEGGCAGYEYGMSFDVEKPGDTKLEVQGLTVLIDDSSVEYVEGCEVDFDDGFDGKGFEIRNPNAETACGCGRSFSKA